MQKKPNMKIFNFFKRKGNNESSSTMPKSNCDKSLLQGKDFEFLLRGDLEISSEKWDEIMTPNSLLWTKELRNDDIHYIVGDDYFTYSWEMPGIQMMFNDEITYRKARKIVDEIIKKLVDIGQDPELVEINKNKVYKFN